MRKGFPPMSDDVFAVGPHRGGVRDAFTALMATMARKGVAVQSVHIGSHRPAIVDAVRAVLRHRRALRRASAVHVEFGSNDRAAFWFGLIAVHLRRDVVLVAHDVPKIALAPAAGLISVRHRVGSLIAFRVLSPLLDRRLIDRALSRARFVVVLSDDAARQVAGRGGRPAAVGLGGHPASIGAPPPSSGEHVLFAGHIGPSKGLHVLVAAWEALSPNEHNLVIAGPVEAQAESYAAPLRRRAEAMGGVTWRGAVESEVEFQDLFARASVVVLPYSSSNPASSILVRAMVEGRCVIATQVPAVEAIIAHEPSALYVVPIDDVGAMAHALRDVLGDPGRRDVLGDRAAVAAQRFNWETTADSVRALYSRGPATRAPLPGRVGSDDLW